MAIVKQYHKDTNTTYVYESESYWDAEKGQSRSRRRVIGKLDPETGEIIPTGSWILKQGRSSLQENADGRKRIPPRTSPAPLTELQHFTPGAWKRSRPWRNGSAPLNSRSPGWNAGMKGWPP